MTNSSQTSEHALYAENGQGANSCLQLRIFCALFLIFVIGTAAYTGISFLHYRITGKPDLSYWTEMGDGDLENQYTACMPGKLSFLNLNGGIARVLGNRRLNEVVRLKNGQLTETVAAVDEAVQQKRSEEIAALQTRLTEQGIPFLYVIAPEKSDPSDPELPTGYEDYTSANINAFEQKLSALQVNYLDLRGELEDSGRDFYSCFYRTDHHWTTETGFYVYTVLADWLEKNCGIAIDPAVTDQANYETHAYQNIFLGSRGKRVGMLYGGVDDFDVIAPKFVSRLTDEDTGEKGDFGDLLVHEDYLKERTQDHQYLESDIYDLVLQSSVHVKNQDAVNDAAIIFGRDSYGFAVQPYLTLALHRTEVFEAYHPQNLHSLVDSTNPQAVILMHCPSFHFGQDESFDFGY